MSAAPEDHSDEEPKPKEDNTSRSDAQTPDHDGMSDAVENFHARNRARKRTIFRGLATGALIGIGKVAGETVAEEVRDDAPGIVQWFLDLMN